MKQQAASTAPIDGAGSALRLSPRSHGKGRLRASASQAALEAGPTAYGYARVSTRDQKEERQIIALEEQGVGAGNIFIDKRSGKDFERPAYKRLMKALRRGDTLFIKSIDRLGRNYMEILEQWRLITKEIGGDVVVLDMPLLDTRSKERDLTGRLIADIVLQLLSYVAETERAYNKQRQAEGVAVARSKGVRFGRPPMERPVGFAKLKAAYVRSEISARHAAKKLGVSPKTFRAWAEDYYSTP